jgi:hypothetical protein
MATVQQTSDSDLTLIEINDEPSKSCKADWQNAFRLMVERSSAIATQSAFDWEGFTL